MRWLVIGGITAGYENSVALDLAAQCRGNGVEFLLGTTALRWADNSLFVAGPVVGFRWLQGMHLVYAGGTRPSTIAELRLVGARLGGVYPAMVAYHLTESGVKLGHRPAVIGSGRWARRIYHALAAHNCPTTLIAPDALQKPDFAATNWLGWSPISLRGHGRVAAIQLEKDGMQQTISCDAVILAGALRPMRNIDGAVFDEAEGSNVSFVQLISETAGETELVNFGRLAASKIIAKFEGV